MRDDAATRCVDVARLEVSLAHVTHKLQEGHELRDTAQSEAAAARCAGPTRT